MIIWTINALSGENIVGCISQLYYNYHIASFFINVKLELANNLVIDSIIHTRLYI